MTKKILSVIFSFVFLFALAFSISWGVINFNKVKTGMASTGVYTNEDIKKSYEDGYDNALKDKAEYTALIAEHRDTITSLNDKISQLTFQITTLSDNNRECNTRIENLNNQKNNLESQVTNLQRIKNENENAIANLDNQISGLQNTVSQLETNKEQNESTIQELNNQISNLQSINSQLQITNQINANTISTLNNQIVSLNNQIHEMSSISQSASAQITALNNRVNELQASVSYYENFVATMENTEQVVATYEVDGSVWKIEIVNKGAQIALTLPDNTDTLIINGWKVNGQGSLLNGSYTLNSNTKFVADVTHKYPVKFMNDAQLHHQQFVTENEFVAIPTPPVKDGYEFIGWSLNGVDVIDGISSVQVTDEVTYYAVYIKLHTVKFMIENELVATQIVKDSCHANDDNVSHKSSGEFRSWQVDDISIDLKTYKVIADTVFIADINYDDWVTNYFTGATQFNGEYIWSDGIDTYFSYYSNQFVLDRLTHTWIAITWNGYSTLLAENVWFDGENYYYSDDSSQFILDIPTKTWSKVQWSGLTSFDGKYIWSDGEEIYYSESDYRTSKHYVLNKKKKTWTSMTWGGNNKIYGDSVWSNGEKYFTVAYGKIYQKQLNIENQYWRTISWTGVDDQYTHVTAWTDGENYYYTKYNNGETYLVDFDTYTLIPLDWSVPVTDFSIKDVWTDGVDVYYSHYLQQYVFDKVNHTWNEITWTTNMCLCSSASAGYIGPYIWSDGTDTYYSRNEQYVYDKTTNTWSVMEWSGYTNFDGYYVWTDGENYYYSEGIDHQYILDKDTHTWVPVEWDFNSNNAALYGTNIWNFSSNTYSFNYGTFLLDKETKTWTQKTWTGFTGNISPTYIWSDGINCYYSAGNDQYIMDFDNYTIAKTEWDGLTKFYGCYVWTDGNDIFYSYGRDQYVLNKETKTWTVREWTGLTNFNGDYVWTDSVDYYYSTQYRLNHKAA